MPTITIDGISHEFEGRPRLLQFCLDRGLDVPHFCYHPAMSAPANCRQCLVEVGMIEVDRETRQPKFGEDGKPIVRYLPKMQTSCSQDMADGMVVRTQRSSDLVERAQKDNLELLLINHPLDCPICDQAGHCPLQIQAYKYGPEGSRFEFEKTHKPKQVELGPRVMLDAERCINCTRCVRFTDEISKSHQLTIIERGVRNYPMTPPGVIFDEPYSMNVIDLCPVGALTSIEFRFKARIWEMSKTASITTSNAKGSNCWYWVKDNRVMNISPRDNERVNGYWLPDEDRQSYDRFNDGRLSSPLVSGKPATWDAAYAEAASVLGSVEPGSILFIGSALATVEDNWLLARLAAFLGAPTPVYIPHVEPGHGDEWLRTDDRTPNARGCEALGFASVDAGALRSRLAAGTIGAMYVLEDDPVASGLFGLGDLASIPVIVHAWHSDNRTLEAARVAIPAAMVVETIGTFVNIDGHAQRVKPAKAIRGVNRTLMMEVGKSRHDLHGTPFDRWFDESNLVDCQPSWVSLPAVASRCGLDTAFSGPRDIMAEIARSVDAFAGVSYEAMGQTGVRLLEAAQMA